MQVMYERCAGLDVHKKTVVACVLTPEGQETPNGQKSQTARHPWSARLSCGYIYSKEALRVRTLCRFLAGLFQSAVAQLNADPEIGTSFHFLDEEFKGL
jgi:hypothetical protein